MTYSFCVPASERHRSHQRANATRNTRRDQRRTMLFNDSRASDRFPGSEQQQSGDAVRDQIAQQRTFQTRETQPLKGIPQSKFLARSVRATASEVIFIFVVIILIDLIKMILF